MKIPESKHVKNKSNKKGERKKMSNNTIEEATINGSMYLFSFISLPSL